MIDKKISMKRIERDSKLNEENERNRMTEEFRRAETQRKQQHKLKDKEEIHEQLLMSSPLKKELIKI